MKIKIEFLDSKIDFYTTNIYSFEIKNKKYLYRISSLLYSISDGETPEEVECFDKNNNEVKLNNKIRFFSAYFDFEFNSKKYLSDISKYVLSNIEQYDNEKILQSYLKLSNLVEKELSKLELPVSISLENGIDAIIKMLKLKINQKDEILDNLLLVIDLEKILNSKKILCFMNLKQYLSTEELLEFYKYATYNSVKVIMIESSNYNYIREYEKIIVIDQNLDEIML